METPNKTEPELLFSIPVDSDHKATELKLLSLSSPHMRAFHLAWLSLFACFFSTFSIPPLLPIIREELKLTQADIGHAGIASFVGSIFSRLAMGPVCDSFGPRVASATVSLVTAPVVLFMCLVSSPLSFIFLRFLIGFSLANFVSSQFWMSSMFSGCTVGVANGLVAGWANVGSGLAQLIMPLIVTIITSLNISYFPAWRVAFILPATLQTVTAIMVLTLGQDLPDGNYKQFSSRKTKNEKENVLDGLLHGLLNYRGWILAITYGFCFGVEMTTDNIIAQYFYDRFNLDLETAGAIAASFGLANIVSRPAGGVLSDLMGKMFGMRGRLWSLWLVQIVAGLLCVALGRVSSLWGSIITMIGFSLFVQAASGLTFGVVPFVSNRSLGVISGMTGSGGTVGAVVTQLLLFSGSNKFPTQTGIFLMGLLVIFSTLPLTLIYFPQWGGMFCGPSIPSDDYYQYQLIA
ncbi:High affinity nitrate transporter 2.7 [Heracleum sosnowskyi]|uniref:High affinity nitrate transporter 2.7 n=1 Tax=Heracleum sosnowskyi TaxID=360622 RepID=A0AAD8H4D7_9APIA|nr:High affinity nitrate transporter 2.7 [Heracleum sosnowskyi]